MAPRLLHPRDGLGSRQWGRGLERLAAAISQIVRSRLTTVLEYHVLAQAVPAADIPFGQQIATVANQDITINAGTPPVIVDTTATPARIVATDVKASNGIIHVIDKVLIPAL